MLQSGFLRLMVSTVEEMAKIGGVSLVVAADMLEVMINRSLEHQEIMKMLQGIETEVKAGKDGVDG